MEGEQFGVDLDRLGVHEAAQMAQEAAVPEGRRLGERLRWRNTLLQDLETLVKVVLEMRACFNMLISKIARFLNNRLRESQLLKRDMHFHTLHF